MNWKKIAEAFGRAVNDPGATQKGRKLVFESKTVKNRPGDVAYDDKDTPAQRAFKHGMFEGDEEYAIAKDATRERYDGEDPDVRRNVMEDEFERREDIVTDNRLEKEFDEGFDAALAKRRGKIRDAMGDAHGAEEAADAGIDDIRKAAIEMLKSGKDIGDVLRILRGE